VNPTAHPSRGRVGTCPSIATLLGVITVCTMSFPPISEVKLENLPYFVANLSKKLHISISIKIGHVL